VVDVAESDDPVDRLLDLLLVLTGRVDDDAINTAREMLGVGQPDAAAEFLTGCLVAGQIPVSSAEQYQLGRVLDDVRSQRGLTDRLHVVESVLDEEHRFGDNDEPGTDLIEAVTSIAGRLGGVRGLWCAWRVTPAGINYGAVPRRVLLAEVGSEGSVTAVGYQLLRALRRAGLHCSVDVYRSGTQLPEYHRDALATAQRVPVTLSARGQNGASRPRSVHVGSASREDALSTGARDLLGEPVAAPRRTEPESVGVREPVRQSGTVRQSEPLASALATEPEMSSTAEADGKGEGNMRVPAAVDAKLTDRERNLLRKLHEELAQREQDRDIPGRGGTARRVAQSDTPASTTLPGTGGFPPISAAAPAQYRGHGGTAH
jgi:hypothetical protein